MGDHSKIRLTMIELNLIPEHLRKRKRRSFSLGGRDVHIPREAVIGLIGGLLVLLLLVHVILQLVIMYQFFQNKKIDRQWEQMSSSQTNVNRVLNELRRLQGNMKAFNDIQGANKVSWAQKLNLISEQLPRGVWLDWISMDGQTLVLRGSSVSKDNTQIISIHNFTENLNQCEPFMQGLKNIETGLIKSRTIQTTPVADFSINAELSEGQQ